MSTGSFGDAWVIVETRKQAFAVSAIYVREIVAMPEVTAIPLCGPQHRGVINLRGRILPLIDMRKQFGWQSVQEEMDDFYKLMGQREQDHRNWLKELEKSVSEGTEFRLARDPHKCAFGQWYDAYRSESPWVTALLRRFELPHGRIHALATSIDELMKNGKNEGALRQIESARKGAFHEMISLFEELKELTLETVKELAMVITLTRGVFAVSIDRAVGVERIPPDMIKEVQTGTASLGRGLVHRVAQRSAIGSLALVLEPGLFVPASPD